MFAVGVNLSLDDFKHAFQRPGVIALGYVGQFALKPLIGYALAHSLVPSLGLPEAIGKANFPYRSVNWADCTQCSSTSKFSDGQLELRSSGRSKVWAKSGHWRTPCCLPGIVD